MVHENASPVDVQPGRALRKREARASAILDEAMVILAAEGLDALTLARLARSLDIVPAALYRYFDSKDALVAALQRRAVGTIHERLRATLAEIDERAARTAPEVLALARILGGARFYLALPRTEPQAAFLVMLLMGDPRPLLSDEESRRTAPHLAALLADVEATFRGAAEIGALARGDGIERTLAFWAVLQGALSLEKARRIAPHLPSSAEVGEAAIRAVLAGWGASAAHLGRAARLLEKVRS